MGGYSDSKTNSMKIAALACLAAALILRLIGFFSSISYTNFLSIIVNLALMAALVLWGLGLWQGKDQLFMIGGFCFAGGEGIYLIRWLINELGALRWAEWSDLYFLLIYAAMLAFGLLLSLMVIQKAQGNCMVFGWCAAGSRFLYQVIFLMRYHHLNWRIALLCLCEVGFAVLVTLIVQEVFTSGYTGVKTAEVSGSTAPRTTARHAPAAKMDFNCGVEALRKLNELLEAGYLTQEEYDAKRAEILARM